MKKSKTKAIDREATKAGERDGMLAMCGLIECSTCRSWTFDTKPASFFHSRRCVG